MAELTTTTALHEVHIKPSQGWLRVRWRELWEYRDLLVLLVKRDFTSRYKQTILGPLWFIVQPLLTTALYVVIFGRVAQLPTDEVPPPLFYLCGLLAWNYFAQNVTSGAAIFTTNAHLFGKVYFPRLIVPAAGIVGNLCTFAIQLIPFGLMLGYYLLFTEHGHSIHLGWPLLFIPLLLLQVSLFSLGVCLWLSAASAKYRDLVHLNAFLIQLWMFASPIIYPLSKVPPSLKWLVWLNPMAPIVEAFRISFLGRGTLDSAAMIVSIVITLLLALSGIMIFQKTERTAMDSV